MEKELCEICKSSIHENDKVAICPSCSHYFHFDHLSHWIQQSQSCPNCRSEFSWEFVKYFSSFQNTSISYLPTRNQTINQVRQIQGQNIQRFVGPLDMDDIEKRIEENQCIVCTREIGTIWNKLTPYRFCSYNHFAQIHSRIYLILGLLIGIIGTILGYLGIVHPINVMTYGIIVFLILMGMYANANADGKYIQLMLNSYEKADPPFYRFMQGLLILFVIGFYFLIVEYNNFYA